jgi:hypothetical protein
MSKSSNLDRVRRKPIVRVDNEPLWVKIVLDFIQKFQGVFGRQPTDLEVLLHTDTPTWKTQAARAWHKKKNSPAKEQKWRARDRIGDTSSARWLILEALPYEDATEWISVAQLATTVGCGTTAVRYWLRVSIEAGMARVRETVRSGSAGPPIRYFYARVRNE